MDKIRIEYIQTKKMRNVHCKIIKQKNKTNRNIYIYIIKTEKENIRKDTKIVFMKCDLINESFVYDFHLFSPYRRHAIKTP